MAARYRITLIELVAFLVAMVCLCAIIPSTVATTREPRERTMCGTRLNGLYKALNTYSVANREQFPIYHAGDPSGAVLGFREGDRSTGMGAALDNNITAPWWVIVGDGSVSPENYICPSTFDAADGLTISTTNSATAQLEDTRDFLERKNLSYSPMNPHHPLVRDRWGPNTNVDWVFMADNNANDYPGTPGIPGTRGVRGVPAWHTLGKGAAAADVQKAENSPNHGYEGQNLMYGDGHVSFWNDPFQGPGSDNVYAYTMDGSNVPPTIVRTAGGPDDVVLIPLSGNGGGSGSLTGSSIDVTYRPSSRGRSSLWASIGFGAFILTIAIWVFLLARSRRAEWVSDSRAAG